MLTSTSALGYPANYVIYLGYAYYSNRGTEVQMSVGLKKKIFTNRLATSRFDREGVRARPYTLVRGLRFDVYSITTNQRHITLSCRLA